MPGQIYIYISVTALCLPGTVSPNGLEICETCEKGHYQNEYGQKECKTCPDRFTTKRRGVMELSDCKGMFLILLNLSCVP